MRIKLKESSVLLFLLIIVFVLEYHFWYLIEIPSFYVRAILGRFSRIGLGFFALFIWFLLTKYKVPQSIKTLCNFSLFAFFALSIYSYLMRPSQGLFYVLGGTSQYLCFLYAKPLYILLAKYKKEEQLLRWMQIILLIWYFVMLYQSFVMNNTGQLFLKEYYTNDYVLIGVGRYENARINAFSLGIIIPLYSFYVFLSNKSEKELTKVEALWHIIIIAIGTYCIIFISQSRMETLAYLFGMFAMYLFRPTSRNQSITKSIVLLAVVFVAFATGAITNFIDTFGSASALYYSTYKRFAEYSFFTSLFIHNPLLGHGLYYSDYPVMYNSGTAMGIMWNNDVGIVGMLGSTGIIGSFSFLYIIARMIKCIKNTIGHNSKYKTLIIGLFAYTCLGSITILFTDPTMIMFLPVVFSFTEYYIERQKRCC